MVGSDLRRHEQVYGAIAFYLGHRGEIDRYLEAQERDYEGKRAAARAADPEFYARLAAARGKLAAEGAAGGCPRGGLWTDTEAEGVEVKILVPHV